MNPKFPESEGVVADLVHVGFQINPLNLKLLWPLTTIRVAAICSFGIQNLPQRTHGLKTHSQYSIFFFCSADRPEFALCLNVDQMLVLQISHAEYESEIHRADAVTADGKAAARR